MRGFATLVKKLLLGRRMEEAAQGEAVAVAEAAVW